jgi:hypothetical protein
MRTGTRNEHLRQSFGNLWLIATVSLKGLRVELPGAVSWYSEVFDRARARHQLTRVEAIAIAFALHSAFGKLDEDWDANTGLRSPCPNIHPNFLWVNIRPNFQSLTYFWQ